MTTAAARWTIALSIAGVLCITYVVFPNTADSSPILYQTIAWCVVAVMTLSVLRMPPRARGVWWGVLGYVVLASVGDLVYNIEFHGLEELPYPGPADAIYLGAYVSAFIALGLLIRSVQPGRDLEAWIDSAILALAAASIVGVLVVDPLLTSGADDRIATATSIGYPLIDIFLLAGLIRLLVGRGRINPAIALLCIAFGVTLIADLFCSFISANGFDDAAPAWLDVLYLAAMMTMAAAANAPGAASLAVRPTPRSLTETASTGRLVTLAVGALTVPAVLVIAAWNDGGIELKLLTIASAAVVFLVLWRVRLLLVVVQRQSARLASLAQTDALTRLPNRRSLDLELDRLTESATQLRAPLTIAMLDLDHFKTYNDVNGHPAGDAALLACARAWSHEIGGSGILARYGGEEFALLLPGLGLAAAEPILTRVHAATPSGLSVSIGYAETRPGESGYETMSRADRALYLAKDSGRNRIVTGSELVPE